jgi:hypothetical protein
LITISAFTIFSISTLTFVKKMGKHKFTAGWCDQCGGEAKTLPKDGNGKFLPCSEAPEDGKTIIINFYRSFVFSCL